MAGHRVRDVPRPTLSCEQLALVARNTAAITRGASVERLQRYTMTAPTIMRREHDDPAGNDTE